MTDTTTVTYTIRLTRRIPRDHYDAIRRWVAKVDGVQVDYREWLVPTMPGNVRAKLDGLGAEIAAE